ncbi:DUF6463 family protein [Streptomyces sp. NPDC006197]|uniref:DUF6463 family protein n=1 Tax=Streptomyces sp. NPDC006197 TaxID=3156685 RepID=UPI0033AD7AF2
MTLSISSESPIPAARGLLRWVPSLLLVAAGMHSIVAVVGVVGAFSFWGDITKAGVIGAVGSHDDRTLVLWFTVCGLALAALGTLTQWILRTVGSLPSQLDFWLLAMGALIAALQPVSGGWLVIGIGGLALVAAQQRGEKTDVA